MHQANNNSLIRRMLSKLLIMTNEVHIGMSAMLLLHCAQFLLKCDGAHVCMQSPMLTVLSP